MIRWYTGDAQRHDIGMTRERETGAQNHKTGARNLNKDSKRTMNHLKLPI